MIEEIQRAIESALPGAQARVTSGSAGHFEIHVTCAAFDGRSPVQKQRMVYAAIAHLMKGDNAPVHAVDRLLTTP